MFVIDKLFSVFAYYLVVVWLSVQAQLIVWKDSSPKIRNDQLCVEWDVKLYSLTHSLSPSHTDAFQQCTVFEKTLRISYLRHVTNAQELRRTNQKQLSMIVLLHRDTDV